MSWIRNTAFKARKFELWLELIFFRELMISLPLHGKSIKLIDRDGISICFLLHILLFEGPNAKKCGNQKGTGTVPHGTRYGTGPPQYGTNSDRADFLLKHFQSFLSRLSFLKIKSPKSGEIE
jgi:hypothetical protein